MDENEALSEDGFRKITLPEFADAAPTAAPLSAEDITALRKGAHISRAVVTKYGRASLAGRTRIEAADGPSVGIAQCDPP